MHTQSKISMVMVPLCISLYYRRSISQKYQMQLLRHALWQVSHAMADARRPTLNTLLHTILASIKTIYAPSETQISVQFQQTLLIKYYLCCFMPLCPIFDSPHWYWLLVTATVGQYRHIVPQLHHKLPYVVCLNPAETQRSVPRKQLHSWQTGSTFELSCTLRVSS